MKPGRITRSYMEVCCAKCVNWSPTFGYNVKDSIAILNSRGGWRKLRGIGWICPDCVAALAALEVEASDG